MFSIVSIKNCNHKSLGIYYLYSSLLFGISGTLCSMILRLELYSSGHRIISSENQNFYNFIFTLHGLLMIFFHIYSFINYFTFLIPKDFQKINRIKVFPMII